MSCSHAVDVDRVGHVFLSRAAELSSRIQDIFWLPRLPASIILPSLSSLHPLESPLTLSSPGSLRATLCGGQLVLCSLSLMLVQKQLPED